MTNRTHNVGPGTAERHIRPQIQDLVTENIADMAVRAQQLGGVIPLWYGEGDMVTPAFVRDAAKTAFDDGLTFYIPDMRGHRPLIDALSAYQTKLHGKPFGLDRSTVAPGGMAALLLAVELVCDLGNNIVYVEPQWPNINRVIHLVGGEPRPVSLDYADGAWKLDLDKLFAACDARTRAIFFSSPSNPCGWVASEAEMQAMLQFSRERGIWLIHDEVYNRLYFKDESGVAPCLSRLAEPEDLVMGVNSFSKSWAMTGWRVGWLTHPPSVSQRLSAMTQYMTRGTSGPLLGGAAVAIAQGDGLIAEIRERARNGIKAAHAALDACSQIEMPKPADGGMYVFFKLKGESDSRAAARRILEECRVGLAPGYMFGKAGAGFIRMCILRNPDDLKVALDRMATVLR